MVFSPPGQWGKENESDLVALCSRHEETDRFTRFVYTRVVSLFHRMAGAKDTVCYAFLILVHFSPSLYPGVELYLVYNQRYLLMHICYTQKRKDLESGVWYYNERKIKSWTYMLSLIISGLLPATSIIILYYLKDPTAVLITIFVYNMVFVLVLGLMVKAKRVEIFAAATA